VILGVGNLLWGDEGFGPRTVARLMDAEQVPAGVEIFDGGTQGLYLLPIIQAARRLLVFDCVDFGAAAGRIMVLRDREIPVFFGQRPLSLHQTAFTDVLAAAELTGRMPEAVTLVGVQLEDIDAWGGDLTPSVAGAMEAAIRIGLEELAAWAGLISNASPAVRPEPVEG